MAKNPTWSTWGRAHSTNPSTSFAPRSIQEAQDFVRATALGGERLKVIGASRSSSAIAQPSGAVMSLEYLTGLIKIDREKNLATFLAGTSVNSANRALAHYGLAFENLGRLGAQTLAGAISTGTHGTGITFGIIPTQVEELELVTATGELLTCSHTHNTEIFRAALVGLGALGVLVTITFRVVPMFRLHAAERGHSYTKIVDSFAERARGADHYEFNWFPGSSEVRTRRLTRLPLLPEGFLHPAARLSQVRRHGGDYLLNNGVYEAMCLLGTTVPATQKALNFVSTHGKGNRRYADLAPGVFMINRTVHQNNMEYAFALADFQTVMQDVRTSLNKLQHLPTFPLVVRTAAADNIPLSQASGRETVFISAREYWRKPVEEYFGTLEKVLIEHGGRPHWGQFHSMDAAALAEVYPQFEQFTGLREKMDPTGLFLNPYLEKVLVR